MIAYMVDGHMWDSTKGVVAESEIARSAVHPPVTQRDIRGNVSRQPVTLSNIRGFGASPIGSITVIFG